MSRALVPSNTLIYPAMPPAWGECSSRLRKIALGSTTAKSPRNQRGPTASARPGAAAFTALEEGDMLSKPLSKRVGAARRQRTSDFPHVRTGPRSVELVVEIAPSLDRKS